MAHVVAVDGKGVPVDEGGRRVHERRHGVVVEKERVAPDDLEIHDRRLLSRRIRVEREREKREREKASRMADIAILVAEEYERRTKNYPRTKLKADEGGVGGDRFEGLSLRLVSSSVSSFSERVKNKMVGEEKKLEMVKWVLEPKCPLSLAASDGLFSA